MKNQKLIILAVIVIILILAVLARLFLNGGEDNWIKDSKGIYIKHGNPSNTPDYVKAQQQIIAKSIELYNQKKSENMRFSSQCLGSIEDYAVDIVHVPRAEEDNLAENQCLDYREGRAHHFIELEKNGEIVRIA